MRGQMQTFILRAPGCTESVMKFSFPSHLNAKYWRLLIVFFLAGGPLGALILAFVDSPHLLGRKDWYEIVLAFMIFGWLFGVIPGMLTATLAVVCNWRRNINGVVALVLAGLVFSLLAMTIMNGISEFMGFYLLAGGSASLLLAPLLPAAHCPPVHEGLASAKGRRWLLCAIFIALPLLIVLAALLYTMALYLGGSTRSLLHLFQESLFLSALYSTPIVFVVTFAAIALIKPRDDAERTENL